MKTLLMVFIGGGAGSMLRFVFSKWLNDSVFPTGTLIANVIASLILGYLTGKVLEQNSAIKAFLAIGFCGGFSTFSTFSNESFQFLQDGEFLRAALHTLLNFGLSLAGIGVGLYLVK